MWIDNVVLSLFALTSPHRHYGSVADGEIGEANELTSRRSHNSQCVAYAMAGEEADESSCKAVALWGDVKVAEREGGGAMVEEAVLEINVAVEVTDVEAATQRPQAQ